MEYAIDGRTYRAALSGDDIVIDGRTCTVSMISSTPDSMEFLLDGVYHKVVFEGSSGGRTSMSVDGAAIDVMTRTGLDDIVYKNSGRVGEVVSESSLHSQIPGKVVSVAVAAGDHVEEGDTICVLESMKMQVSVKSHITGTVRVVRPGVGASVAKGDVIAEIE